MTAVPSAAEPNRSPALAGYLLGVSTFGLSLIVGGGLKIVYDVLLYRAFSGSTLGSDKE